MSEKSEALRLANFLEMHWCNVDMPEAKAAAELRRLVAENERLAAEVANRNRRALAGDEAVAALANVHAHYEGLEAQRDALLEALKQCRNAIQGGQTIEPYDSQGAGYQQCFGIAFLDQLNAAIKAVEEGK